MFIRAAQAADAPAMGRVMVDTYLRAHKEQLPDEVWHRRQIEWTPAESATAWARAISAIAADNNARECIYVAIESTSGHDALIGLIMGGPSGIAGWEHAGDIYALYVDFAHHRHGVGRSLIRAAVAQLRQLGMTELIIRSLPANAPTNQFYEALGGQMAGECAAEDYGYQIPERIYHWADSSILLEDGGSNGTSNPRPIGETSDAG